MRGAEWPAVLYWIASKKKVNCLPMTFYRPIQNHHKMELKPHQPPKAINDPKQRIEYLRTFLGTIRPGMVSRDDTGWCEHIRGDINAITDETVQTQAKALFDQIISAIYWPNPSEVYERVKTKTENLITYLEKHDCQKFFQ